MSPSGKARSIGEVLEELVEDFPDISVSKIRFLEAQGLISPARTRSGYRQFSDDDVALLRWILALQREHYLPLKVIRKRLRDGDGPQATTPAPAGPAPSEALPAVATPAPATLSPADPAAEAPPVAWYLEDDDPAFGPFPAPAAAPDPAAPPVEDMWSTPAGNRTWSPAELAAYVGLDEAAVSELASFGLLPEEGGRLGPESVPAARAAAGFFRYGIEARHLRMYKTFAEREAALFEQVVPMTGGRHDESRARAKEALAELAQLGEALRLSMLRAALGPSLGTP